MTSRYRIRKNKVKGCEAICQTMSFMRSNSWVQKKARISGLREGTKLKEKKNESYKRKTTFKDFRYIYIISIERSSAKETSIELFLYIVQIEKDPSN